MRRVLAFYPGPAGSTESLLSWRRGMRSQPGIRRCETWSRTLRRCWSIALARRGDHYLVPIDQCYELVGLIRMHWRGLSGGDDVWREIGRFFAQLTGGGTCLT